MRSILSLCIIIFLVLASGSAVLSTEPESRQARGKIINLRNYSYYKTTPSTFKIIIVLDAYPGDLFIFEYEKEPGVYDNNYHEIIYPIKDAFKNNKPINIEYKVNPEKNINIIEHAWIDKEIKK